jgi:hypothetical protein
MIVHSDSLFLEVLGCCLEICSVAVDSSLRKEIAVFAEEEDQCANVSVKGVDFALDDAIDHAIQDVVLFELRNVGQG